MCMIYHQIFNKVIIFAPSPAHLKMYIFLNGQKEKHKGRDYKICKESKEKEGDRDFPEVYTYICHSS